MQGREMIHYFEVSSCSLKLCIMFFATAAKPQKMVTKKIHAIRTAKKVELLILISILEP